MKAGFGAFLVSIGSAAWPSARSTATICPISPMSYEYEEHCEDSDKLKRVLINLHLPVVS